MFSKVQTELQSYEAPDLFDESSLFSGTKHHLHLRNSSKTFPWFATDNPRRLNPKSQYKEHDITYKFNSDGYRCDELVQSDIVFLGCSYTFGVGLSLEDIWANKVAKELNIPYINLAYPAGTLTYNLRTLMKTWDVIRPKTVIGLFPYNHRLEFLSDDPSNPLKVWTKGGIRSPHFEGSDREKLLNYELYTTRTQEDHLLLSNLFYLNQFITAQNSKFLWSVWEYEEGKSDYFKKQQKANQNQLGKYVETEIFSNHTRWEKLELRARDSSHPGPVYHRDFASLILNNLDS